MTETLATAPALSAEEIVKLCCEHTLFEWGSQEVTPLPIDRATQRVDHQQRIDNQHFTYFQKVQRRKPFGGRQRLLRLAVEQDEFSVAGEYLADSHRDTSGPDRRTGSLE